MSDCGSLTRVRPRKGKLRSLYQASRASGCQSELFEKENGVNECGGSYLRDVRKKDSASTVNKMCQDKGI